MNITSKVLNEGIDDIYTKYYQTGQHHVDRDIFDDIIRLDPTFKPERDKLGSYGKQLLHIIVDLNQELSDQDQQELVDQLEIFDKHKISYDFEDRDIGKLKSLQDLINLNNKYDSSNVSNEYIKAKNVDGLNLIGQNQNWEIYNPTTYEASKQIRGDNAVQCTGRADMRSYFDHYTRDGKILVVFINRHDRDDKYQGAFYTDGRCTEFADARNKHFAFEIFISDNQDILNILDKNEFGKKIADRVREYVEAVSRVKDSLKTHISNNTLILQDDLFIALNNINNKEVDQIFQCLKTLNIESLCINNDILKASFDIDFCINKLRERLSIHKLILAEDITDITTGRIINILPKFNKIGIAKTAKLRCYDQQKDMLKKAAVFY